MKTMVKISSGALVFTIVLISLSFLINALWLGNIHDRHPFFRPVTDIRVTPGLALTTLLWGIMLNLGYRLTSGWIKVRKPFLRGAVYGLSVFILYIFCHELYYYQFIKFDIMILAGGLIHYLMTLVLGGGFIGLINREIQCH
jgi:hypothetical protein